jgi:hypothetical protein
VEGSITKATRGSTRNRASHSGKSHREERYTGVYDVALSLLFRRRFPIIPSPLVLFQIPNKNGGCSNVMLHEVDSRGCHSGLD